MSWVLSTSMLVRLIATGWSFVLLRRYRDARLGLLSALLALMTLDQLISLVRDHESWALSAPGSAAVGLGPLVSGLALAAVVALGRVVSDHQAGAPRRLIAILEATTDLVSMADRNGVVLYLNRAGREMLGLGEDEDISGGRVSDYHPETEARKILTEALPVAVSEGAWTGESVFLGRDGRQIPTWQVIVAHRSPRGEIEFFSTIARDFTARKETEQALQRSEERFRTTFDQSAIGKALVGADFRFRKVNPALCRFFGYSEEELLGMTVMDVTHPKDRPVGRTSQGRMLAGEIGGFRIEKRYINRQGEVVWGLLNLTVVTDPHSREQLSLSELQDITERKRADAQREELITELEAKNEELERFTYTLSHDLKSPIVTIRGFLGLLEKDAAAGDTEEMEKDMARIRTATEIMQQLLDELLELSRIGRLVHPSEKVSLSELAREVVDQIDAGAIRAEIEIDPELPVVFGDRLRLRQLLDNLIGNAVKYMGSQAAPRVEVGKRQEGEEEVVCFVRDNGIGIDSRYHEKIFGLFDRLEASSVDGTGIGLALVKRIVETHHGRVWVESEGTGHGSTFCFMLPS